MRDSPYKFLDPYDVEDHDLLFGRERESRILVSDVVVSRLVVLFAATGTGKTSLINGAVRPRLTERGYATFFVRVRRDPAESVKTELAAHPDLGGLEDISLPPLLAGVSARLQKPIVLFFDQFEEFFIYTCRENAGAASTFIDDVATLYGKRGLGVHFVFSMREEFFVEMDAFRDVIPSIFHNESNLRLRWFDESQSRDAIVLPARAFKTEIDSPLVERLIGDLWDTAKKGIEPAQLQVVCDTLWRNRTGDHITVADYERIGRGGRAGHGGGRANIAREVLYQRLEAEFGRIETEEQLALLERLLPQLRTEDETKALRDLDGLATALDTDKEPLRVLIARLEESRLIRTSIRGDSLLVELLHDYLVGRLDDLRDRVQLIWPRRILTAAMHQYEVVGEFIPPEQLPVVLQHADRLGLKRSEAEFLFRSALAHGAYTHEWFVCAGKVGVPVWDVFRNIIESRDTRGATYTIKFLSELGGSEAFELLGLALERDFIAPYVLEALSQIENVAAVEMIAGMLHREQLAPYAEQLLERMGTFSQNAEIASRARQALSRQHHRRLPATRSPSHEEASVTATLLDEHFRVIIRAMADGRVIPMLGPGVNVLDHEPDATRSHAQPSRLALPSELAWHLAHGFRWPVDEPYDLARVSQYVATIAGKGQLYEELHGILDVDFPPTAIHRFLASVPGELRAKGYLPKRYPSGYQLIVSANYDDVLERAFRAVGEPFDLVTYVAEGEQRGKFLHWPPDGDARLIDRPNEYPGLSLEERTVILKVCGGVNRANAERDSYVITEDDYIEYLARTDLSDRLPVRLAAELHRSHFLFLGYSLTDWYLRAILHLIWRRQRLSYQSWSVQLSHQQTERYLWRRHGVDLLDVRLEDYVAALREQLHALEPRSRR